MLLKLKVLISLVTKTVVSMLLKSLQDKKKTLHACMEKERSACKGKALDCFSLGNHGPPSGDNQALLKSSILTACMQGLLVSYAFKIFDFNKPQYLLVKIEDFKSILL